MELKLRKNVATGRGLRNVWYLALGTHPLPICRLCKKQFQYDEEAYIVWGGVDKFFAHQNCTNYGPYKGTEARKCTLVKEMPQEMD